MACPCNAARFTSIATCTAVPPERLHEEITADYTDMIYAATAEEIEERRRAFVRKRRFRHRAVADSLEEAGPPPWFHERNWDKETPHSRCGLCTCLRRSVHIQNNI